MGIYVQAATQISIQKPLSNEWFSQPILYEQNMVNAIEPNYRDFFEPNVARRIGKILKRATVTAGCALNEAEIQCPDAIIIGTGLGCVESTEKFLSAMVQNGEEFLQPTFFMQSTHNTISSQIAVKLKCHGYNNTHVHDGVSFESALLDAFMNFELGKINNALVGANDELTPNYHTLLDKINYWKKEPVTQQNLLEAKTIGSFSGEVSVSVTLQNNQNKLSKCELRAVEIIHNPSQQQLSCTLNEVLNCSGLNLADIDAVFIGKSGDKPNDEVYSTNAQQLFPNTPLVWYKHIFGESYSASALGFYAAITCINNGSIPHFMLLNSKTDINNPKNILLYNHFQNRDHSFILITSC